MFNVQRVWCSIINLVILQDPGNRAELRALHRAQDNEPAKLSAVIDQ